VLKIADPDKVFLICTDACQEGLGGVLSQDNYVIAYESRKLKIHEKNYATHDLELETIIHALKMWRHYLIGRKFVLMSDNISLKYLFDQQNLNARQAQWLAFLSEYDFEIKHIKGKENKVADALSRHANSIYMTACSSYISDFEGRIKSAAENDEKFKEIMQKLLENLAENENDRFRLSKNGLLMCKNRLYIPNSTDLKTIILNEMHKKPYSGHPGYQKTITML